MTQYPTEELSDQVCWLLEWAGDKHLPVRYYAADENQPVLDPHLATRFSRREDALAVGKAVGLSPKGQWRIPSTNQCTAVEHIFLGAKAKEPPPPSDMVERVRVLAADIMAAMRRARFPKEYPAEAHDEFEALTLVPMLEAALTTTPIAGTDVPDLTPEEEAELVERINSSPNLHPVTDKRLREALPIFQQVTELADILASDVPISASARKQISLAYETLNALARKGV